MTDPQTTPTRDEAVRDVLAQTERRENGLRANMDEVATLAHQMISIIRRGALRPDPKTGWLEPASAPAPASGRVDAVAWRTVSDFVDEMLRDWAGGDDCRMGFGLNGATVTKGQFRAVQAALASLPPAATPVSEAGGEAVARSWRRTKFEFIGAMRQALINSGLTREQVIIADNAITEAFSALAKPASSPAGGDVRDGARIVGMGDTVNEAAHDR